MPPSTVAISTLDNSIPPAPTVRNMLSLQYIHASTNYRKSMDKDALTELAQSFGTSPTGIKQDLLVRPHPTLGGNHVEVVFGYRRLSAAQIAGFTEVPVRIEHLSDAEVLELQLIENMQREDVHPMDEAEGLDRLKADHSTTTLAAKIGKSVTTVYRRLQLMKLVEAAREAFRQNKLYEESAFMLSRVPRALQEKALYDITHTTEWKGGKNVVVELEGPAHPDDVYKLLTTKFMLALGKDAKVPFDTKDATLVPEAGACGPCPKRTGNAKDLFGDVDGDDTCTDPVCFRAKTDAAFAIKSAAVIEKGGKVLDDAVELKVIFPAHINGLAHDAPYIDLDDQTYEFNKPTTKGAALSKVEKELKETLPRYVAQNPQTGRGLVLVEKAAYEKLLKKSPTVQAVKKKQANPSTGRTPEQEAVRKKELAARKVRQAVLTKVAGLIRQSLSSGSSVPLDTLTALMRSAVTVLARRSATIAADIQNALQKKPLSTKERVGKDYELSADFIESVPKQGLTQLLENLVAFTVTELEGESYPAHALALAKEFGVDVKVLEKAEAKESDAKVEKAKAEQPTKAPKSKKAAVKQDRKAKAKKAAASKPAAKKPSKK